MNRSNANARHPGVSAIFVATVLSLAQVIIGIIPLGEQSASASDELMRDKGLHRVGGAMVWSLPEETRLQKKLEHIKELPKKMQSVEKSLDARVQGNLQLWEVLKQTESNLQRLKSSGTATKAQLQQVENQVSVARLGAVTPAQLGAEPDVQEKLMELTSARNELIVSIHWIRNSLPRLVAAYEEIKKDAEIVEVINRGNRAQKLGPVVDFDRVLAELKPLEQIAYSFTLPLYQQSGQSRFGAVLNETLPVTFSWHADAAQTTITTNMIQAAGLKVPANAVVERIKLSQGRQVRAVRLSIPYLRFGGCLLQNIDAYVIPPDAEDYGAEIGKAAFSDLKIEADPERLRIVFQARE